MIKLAYKIPQDRFSPELECWKVDDDIEICIVRYDTYAYVTIWHTTGDIADQIYDKIKSDEYFSDLKLGGISNYAVDVPLEKVEKFLQYIEKIDRSQLREGKRY